MPTYPKTQAEYNDFPVLSYPIPRWTYEQRKQLTRDRNQHHGNGRGTKRRDAAEFKIADALVWLAALVHGDEGARTRQGKPLLIARGLYERLGHCTPGTWDLRKKIRAAVSWAVSNGPASGWAVPAPAPQGEPSDALTPYLVPRRSQYAAEKWVRFVRDQYRLVALFAAVCSKVSPAQRTQLRENGRAKKALPVLSRSVDASTGLRAHEPRSEDPPRPLTPRSEDPPRPPTPTSEDPPRPDPRPCECESCRDGERWLRALHRKPGSVEREPWYQRALARGEHGA